MHVCYYVWQSHKDTTRASVLDVWESVDVTHLTENTHIVAEALARYVFNLTSAEVFSSSLVSGVCKVTELFGLGLHTSYTWNSPSKTEQFLICELKVAVRQVTVGSTR